MRKKKKIAYGIMAFLLLVTACSLSYFYGFRQGIKAGGITASMAELWINSEQYNEQLRNADCDGVKQAINEHLFMTEKYKDIEGSLIWGTAHYMDKMLDHIRLSRIEDKLGNKQAAGKHMGIALEACKDLKWKECTEEKLLYFQNRIDKDKHIACLSDIN